MDVKNPIESKQIITKNSIYYQAYDRAMRDYKPYIDHECYQFLIESVKKSIKQNKNSVLIEALEKLGEI